MLELKKGKRGIVYLLKDGQVVSEISFKNAKTKKKIRVGVIK